MNENLTIARDEYIAGNFSRAIQFAQYALARDPDNTIALQTIGMSWLRQAHFTEGIDALERAALLRPLGTELQVELAIAYGCVGHRLLSRDLLMLVATTGRANTSQLLRIAAGLEAIDEPRLAMEACRQAGRKTPDAAEVHYQMGYYAQACGHPSSISEALIRHAIGLDPRNIHFRIGLASMLIRLGRKCEALTMIDRVIPDQLEAVTCRCCLKRIANLFFDCDDMERAKLCAERLGMLESGVSHQPARSEAGQS